MEMTSTSCLYGTGNVLYDDTNVNAERGVESRVTHTRTHSLRRMHRTLGHIARASVYPQLSRGVL